MVQISQITFITITILILIAGLSSSFVTKNNSEDYLLANRNISPFNIGLSSFASAHSGFMYTGFIGFSYFHGVYAFWYIISWLIGDAIVWMYIYKPLREISQKENSNTLNRFISVQNNKTEKTLLKSTSILSFIFLSVFAGVQILVASKVLNYLFPISTSVAVFITGATILAYCLSGGIRASIWTDSIQAVLMLIGLVVTVNLSLTESGGFQGAYQTLSDSFPQLLSWSNNQVLISVIIFFVSLIINGMGVVGQPHIMSRPMSINSSKNIKIAAIFYFSSYLFFSLLAMLAGILARIIFPDLSNIEAESALIKLSSQLCSPFLLGVIMTGMFSCAVSTADSQIISCSSNISEDLLNPENKEHSFTYNKLSTLFASAIAIFIALSSSQTVFDLTLITWATLASCIGPGVILKSLGKSVSGKEYLIMTIPAIALTLAWKYYFHLDDQFHEAAVGLPLALVIYYLLGKFSKLRLKDI